jgi:cyanuric acid amidohydrolase
MSGVGSSSTKLRPNDRQAIRRCRVFRVATADPADVTGLMELIGSGTVVAAEIRAILGKTEGNGCVNDFTRACALTALQAALASPLGCAPADVMSRSSPAADIGKGRHR